MPRQEKALLTNAAALDLGDASRTKGGEKIGGHGTTSCPPGTPFFSHADSGRISRLDAFCLRVGRQANIYHRCK
jgi:hypothetical protein